MKVHAASNTLLPPGYHQRLNQEVLQQESTKFHLLQMLDACIQVKCEITTS